MSDNKEETTKESVDSQDSKDRSADTGNKQGKDSDNEPESTNVAGIEKPERVKRAKSSGKGSTNNSSKNKKKFVRPGDKAIHSTEEQFCRFLVAFGIVPGVVEMNGDKKVIRPIIKPSDIQVPFPYGKDDNGIPVFGSMAEILAYHLGELSIESGFSGIERFANKYPKIWSSMIIAICTAVFIQQNRMAYESVIHGSNKAKNEAPVQNGSNSGPTPAQQANSKN